MPAVLHLVQVYTRIFGKVTAGYKGLRHVSPNHEVAIEKV